MAIILPDSDEIKLITLALNELVDIETQRLEIEQEILDVLKFGMPAVGFEFTATIVPGGTPQKGVTAMQLTDVQSVQLSIQPIDAKNNPAPVESGSVVWASSDPTIVTVGPDPTDPTNELKQVATAVGPLTAPGASVQVSVTADADLGAGVTTITGTLDFTVVASQAVSVAIQTGTPTP